MSTTKRQDKSKQCAGLPIEGGLLSAQTDTEQWLLHRIHTQNPVNETVYMRIIRSGFQYVYCGENPVNRRVNPTPSPVLPDGTCRPRGCAAYIEIDPESALNVESSEVEKSASERRSGTAYLFVIAAPRPSGEWFLDSIPKPSAGGALFSLPGRSTDLQL